MKEPEIVLDTEENHVLVAYLPTTKDLALAQREGWYRIPVEHAPKLISEGKATYIAFYQPRAFDDDRYTVRWYSPITGLAIRKRIEFLPDEPHDPNAHKDYYVVGCERLQQLPHPIRSKRPRRPIFFPTTLKRLFTAKDINQLFNDSPLENLLWNELCAAGIPAERQFEVRAGDRWFKLDFAIFCMKNNLGIECDSDKHHIDPVSVEKDKRRMNLLATAGWHILPLTSSMLRKEMPATMHMVREAIAKYGGYQDPADPSGFKYPVEPGDPQPRLFD
ncbi:MAG: hypothetical protein JNL52_09050 [Flavobacteriales bacterium]|nr:hypothetical protein [Flavobacteriales bacterium]